MVPICVALGVLVDVDHLIWAVILENKLVFNAFRTLSFMKLYEQFINPSGILNRKLMSLNRRYVKLVFWIHGLWIAFVAIVTPIIMDNIGLNGYEYLIWLILVSHFASDVTYWFPKIKL